MKKILLMMVLMTLSVSAMAQLKLTPDGLINAENTEQDFIVLDFPDKTQAQLYSAVLVYLNSMYVSPKEVLSVVEGNSITVNGISRDAIYRKKNMTSTIPTFDINYTITILFKEGKIRINNPTINRMNISGSSGSEFYVVGANFLGTKNGIFDSKGKVMFEETKASIEEFFNSYINGVKQCVEKNETTDW